MTSSTSNWCSTCSEECSDVGSICTTCGEELQIPPSTNSINTSESNNASISRSNNLATNLNVGLGLNNGIDGFNDNTNMQLNPEVINYLNSIAGQGEQPPIQSSNRKATSKTFLNQIPRIVIHKHSSLFYEIIIEFTITASTKTNSSESKRDSPVILQFDAVGAEFGPSPPYDIQGEVSSLLDCEKDIKESQTSFITTTLKSASNSNSIAYMMRGKGITFVDRALYAQQKGAEALIIANHVPVWPYIMKDSKKALSQSKLPLTIPVAMIKKTDHVKLAPYLQTPSIQSADLRKHNISCRIHAKNKNENPEDNACIICCEPFEIGDTCIRLPFCFHAFHEKCALVWLKKHNTCPYCRRELPMEDQEEEEERRRMGRSYASNENVDTRANGDPFYG